MTNEDALMDWLEQHSPAIACALGYCNDLDEVRTLLNHHTGIEVQPDDETEDGYRRWLQAFERQ